MSTPQVEHWNAMIMARLKRGQKGLNADQMPSPWEAHQAGWAGGVAAERERIVALLDDLAAQASPVGSTVLRLLAHEIQIAPQTATAGKA